MNRDKKMCLLAMNNAISGTTTKKYSIQEAESEKILVFESLIKDIEESSREIRSSKYNTKTQGSRYSSNSKIRTSIKSTIETNAKCIRYDKIKINLPLDLLCSCILPYLLEEEQDFLKFIRLFRIPYRKTCCTMVNSLVGCKTSFDDAAFFMKMFYNEDRNTERIRRCNERNDKMGKLFAKYFKENGYECEWAQREKLTIVDPPPDKWEKADEYNLNELKRGRFIIHRDDEQYEEKLRELDTGYRYLKVELDSRLKGFAKEQKIGYNPIMQHWDIRCDHPYLDIFLHEDYENAAKLTKKQNCRSDKSSKREKVLRERV